MGEETRSPMTTAEKLAAAKPKRTRRKNGGSSKGKTVVWKCQLATCRTNLRLSILDVAEAIGMSASGLWDVEHGTDPLLTTAMRLSNFYGLAIPTLWPSEVKESK